MKKICTVFALLLLSCGLYCAESSSRIYKYDIGKTVQEMSITPKEEHGKLYPYVSIQCSDGTKWYHTGPFEDVEILRLWKKGDRISVHVSGKGDSNYNILFKNFDCYFERNVYVSLDTSTKSLLPIIVSKDRQEDYDYITLSDGSRWEIGYDYLFSWFGIRKRLSDKWKVGDPVFVGGEYNQITLNRFYYRLVNFDLSPNNPTARNAACVKGADNTFSKQHLVKENKKSQK